MAGHMELESREKEPLRLLGVSGFFFCMKKHYAGISRYKNRDFEPEWIGASE
ncbi:hypothetical protein [Paenibacillus sp. NPDC058174]|uniref:hypothetical protein n=1 Tax=Paenibacillus sp. NPDC058174 TaxID=3346366 RepID=UPI0036D77F91